jgi:Transcriptional regulators
MPQTKRVRLSRKISQQLKEQIICRQFAPGTQLPSESELSRMFSASRTSVREALAVLETEGFISIVRGKGSIVAAQPHPTGALAPAQNADYFETVYAKLDEKPSSILTVMELRKILECETAKLAALRATPADIIEIKMASQKFFIASKERQETASFDIFFHYAISKASRNEFLSDLVQHFQKIYHKIILSKRKQPKSAAEFEKLIAEHAAIIDAIERHEPEEAQKAMEAHVERSHRIAESLILEYINR